MEWLKYLAVYNDGEGILVNGKKQGYQYIRHADGKLRNSYHYVDGIQHGIQRGWYANERLLYEWNYINGSPTNSQRTCCLYNEQMVEIDYVDDVMQQQ
jgi:antitoxin component YwqK of YwqJK toxin-antitoxin module